MGFVSFGALSGTLGSMAVSLGLVEICSSRCDDPAQRAQVARRGLYKLAGGVCAIALSHLIYWRLSADYKPLGALDFYLSKFVSADPTSNVCNLHELQRILNQTSQPKNSALFSLFDCKNFLPWKRGFAESLSDTYKVVFGIGPEDLETSVMWGITPSKAPFMVIGEIDSVVTKQELKMFDSKVNCEFFNLVLGNDYFTATCQKLKNIPRNRHFMFHLNSIAKVGQIDGQLLEPDYIHHLMDRVDCAMNTDTFLSLVEKIKNASKRFGWL